MTTYAVAHLRRVDLNAGIVEYLRRIDATLAPFDGRFVVHGGAPEHLEGAFEGDLVVIGFPSRAQARGWYDSPGYRDILALRTDNAAGETFLVDGVERDHRATDVLPARRSGRADPRSPRSTWWSLVPTPSDAERRAPSFRTRGRGHPWVPTTAPPSWCPHRRRDGGADTTTAVR